MVNLLLFTLLLFYLFLLLSFVVTILIAHYFLFLLLFLLLPFHCLFYFFHFPPKTNPSSTASIHASYPHPPCPSALCPWCCSVCVGLWTVLSPLCSGCWGAATRGVWGVCWGPSTASWPPRACRGCSGACGADSPQRRRAHAHRWGDGCCGGVVDVYVCICVYVYICVYLCVYLCVCIHICYEHMGDVYK